MTFKNPYCLFKMLIGCSGFYSKWTFYLLIPLIPICNLDAVELKRPPSCVEFLSPIPKFSKQQQKWIEKIYPTIIQKNSGWIFRYYLASINIDSSGYILKFSSLSHLQAFRCQDENGSDRIVSDGMAMFRVLEKGDSLIVNVVNDP